MYVVAFCFTVYKSNLYRYSSHIGQKKKKKFKFFIKKKKKQPNKFCARDWGGYWLEYAALINIMVGWRKFKYIIM
jgi:hypothetical protein